MAANAVVGVLRALLTADTASFDTSMRKASVTVGNFGQQVAKLTPQAERIAKAFGGERLLQSANNLVAAVNKVGGAARLTEAEQKRVNAQLTAAIEKYRALGQQAPAAMIATERATRTVDTATSKWGATLGTARTALAALGVTLSTGAVIAFGRSLIQTADTLVRVADTTGLTTTEVQRLEFIARQSGNTIENLTSAIGQLQNRLISGDASAVNAVKVLGLNFQQLRAAAPFEQLEMVATAIAKIENPAARAALAMDLFGRQGIAILPTLIANFEALGDAAPVMADKTVRALDQAGDALDLFQLQLKVWAAEAFNFAGRIFDQFVIVIRRGAAALSDGLAGIASLLARLPGVGAQFTVLADKLRRDAQLLRDAADATAAGLNRQETEIRKNTGALIDYDALLNRSAASTAKVSAASAQLVPILAEHVRWWKGMAPAIEDAQTSATAFMGVLTFGFEEAVARAKELREQMQAIAQAGMGPFDFSAHTSGRATEEAAEIAEDAMEEQREQFRQFIDDLARWTTQSISDSLAEALVGLRSFKDAFVSIWTSIRRTFAQIIASMLDQFIRGFIEPAIRKLGELAGRLAFGGSGSGAGGGGNGWMNLATAGLNFAGGLLGNGGRGGGVGQGNGIANLATSGLSLFGGTGGGLGGFGGGAGGAAGAPSLGFLSNPAFWTNPYTIAGIAAASVLTWGITKKGWFRGGEEGVQVNPRRDKFQMQFARAGESVAEAGHRLAAQLTAWSGEPGGGPLFAAMQSADSVKEWERAQAAIVAEFAKHGTRLKSFAMGGFIPPGVVQPAILHGGAMGELILPVSRMQNPAPTQQHVVHNHYWAVQGWDGDDVKRTVERHIWPLFNRESVLNQHGVGTSIRRAGTR